MSRRPLSEVLYRKEHPPLTARDGLPSLRDAPIRSNSPPRAPARRGHDIAALVAAMTPIAQLCLRRGKGVGEMIVALKLACIEVASLTARVGSRANHSQIAAMTGLTRKDVRMLVHLGTAGPYRGHARALLPRVDRVMNGWKSDCRFLDQRGNPSLLRFVRETRLLWSSCASTVATSRPWRC